MRSLQNISALVWLCAFVFLHIPVPNSGQMQEVRDIKSGCLVVTDLAYSSGDWGTLTEGLHLYPTRNSSYKDQQFSPTGDYATGISGCPYTSKDVSMNLDTIHKIVNSFYANNIAKVGSKIDNGHGFKVLRGQLLYLLEAQQASRLSSSLKSFLVQLKEAIPVQSRDVDEAIVGGNDHTPGSLSGIKHDSTYIPGVMRVTRTWHKSNAITRHFHEFKNIGNEKEVVDSDLSLKCLRHLIRDCSFPTLCQVTQRRDIYSQYMLARQAYLQNAAQKLSCASTNPEAFRNDEEYGERLCSKAYLEAEYLAAHQFPTRFVDLFAEHVGMCGLMGYSNFMRADWLREIISWREGSASGCMADLYGSRRLTDTTVRIPAFGRNDGKSEEECLVHLTSVSLMALSMNLRYMVDVCEPSLFDEYFSSKA